MITSRISQHTVSSPHRSDRNKKMPYFRVGQRAVLVRSAVPMQPINPRLPMYQQPLRRPPAAGRNQLPQHLPVLHAPFFPKENEFYEEEGEIHQAYEEVYSYPTMSIPDQRRTLITQQFPNYTLFQRYLQPQCIRPIQLPAYVYYRH